MIISRTPHRISFFGGGTDYPAYYLEHGGKVLGAAINKFSYLNIRKLPPFFEHKHRIVYSKQESVKTIDEIDHPSVRETLKHLNIQYGVSIHHDGDIPARSGMGSSSSFTVGLLKTLYALEGSMITKHDLALKAIHIEQNLIKEHVGSQDQTFAAYGGLNTIEFLQSGEIVVRPVIISPERLREFENCLLLFYTGISRISSEIAKEQTDNIRNNQKNLSTMKCLVDEAYNILTTDQNIQGFGQLLAENWRLKRSLSERISSNIVDDMYEAALKAGALGGKLLGAGGGGFMLIFAEPHHHDNVKEALKQYLNVPFRFDFGGSEIIVYEPKY